MRASGRMIFNSQKITQKSAVSTTRGHHRAQPLPELAIHEVALAQQVHAKDLKRLQGRAAAEKDGGEGRAAQ